VEGEGSDLTITEVRYGVGKHPTKQLIHGFHDELAAALVWTRTDLWSLPAARQPDEGSSSELDHLPWRGWAACGCSLESSQSGAGVLKPHMPRGSETLYSILARRVIELACNQARDARLQVNWLPHSEQRFCAG
jgi:hypothetical protein